MRLHCHAATAIALPAQPTVSHTDESRTDEQLLPLADCLAPPCSDCHRIASAADCLAHPRAARRRAATAMQPTAMQPTASRPSRRRSTPTSRLPRPPTIAAETAGLVQTVSIREGGGLQPPPPGPDERPPAVQFPASPTLIGSVEGPTKQARGDAPDDPAPSCPAEGSDSGAGGPPGGPKPASQEAAGPPTASRHQPTTVLR